MFPPPLLVKNFWTSVPVANSDIDRMLRMARARNVFKDIAAGTKRRMPCGDSRLAERMRSLGLLRLTVPKEREVTTSWVLTDLGQQKLDEL